MLINLVFNVIKKIFQHKMKKNAHYIHTTMNLVNIICGIFIVDHACETMHKADKTGAPKQEFAFRANTTACWPTVGGGGVEGVVNFFRIFSAFYLLFINT